MIEAEAAKAFEVLHPAHRIFDTNSTRTSTDIALPKQAGLVWGQFLRMFDHRTH